jgi:hypothetical protein
MVKPSALPEDLVGLSPANDPFTKLVPVAVLAKVKEYEERREQLLQQQYATAEQCNAAVRQALQECNLPGAAAGVVLAGLVGWCSLFVCCCSGALDAMTAAAGGLPAELAARIEAVRAAGGEAQLQDLLRAKAQVSAEDARLLDEVTSMLNREEQDDEQGRQKYASDGRWSCSRSNVLTVQLRQELSKLRVALDAAAKSDQLVQSKVADITPDLRAFAMGAQHVATLLPRPQQGAQTAQGGEQFVQPLRQCLAALDALVSHRLRTVARLRELARDDDITSLLMKNPISPEAVFKQQLERYAAPIKELEENAVKQRQQLDVIRDVNRQFVSARSAESVPLREACQRIARAAATFQEVLDNLREGVTFYTELQSLCVRHQRQAQDFCYARAQERTEMMQQAPTQNPYHAAPPSTAAQQNPYYGASAPPAYSQPGFTAQPYQAQQPPYVPPGQHTGQQQQPPYNPYGNRY